MSANWATLSSGQSFPDMYLLLRNTPLDLLTPGQHILPDERSKVKSLQHQFQKVEAYIFENIVTKKLITLTFTHHICIFCLNRISDGTGSLLVCIRAIHVGLPVTLVETFLVHGV